MIVNIDECIEAGLDPAEVEKIAKGISRYARQASKLGMQIFGGSGGSLRVPQDGLGSLVVADLDGVYEGGDGAAYPDENGLLRGEY